jgi:hypothetical protein
VGEDDDRGVDRVAGAFMASVRLVDGVKVATICCYH